MNENVSQFKVNEGTNQFKRTNKKTIFGLVLCSVAMLAVGIALIGTSVFGGTLNSKSPESIEAATPVFDSTKVAAGAYHSLALDDAGYLWAWGYNNFGQLGNGTYSTNYVPARIGDRKYTSIAAGDYHSLAIGTDGYLYAWGYNNKGQVGNKTTATQTTPVKIGTTKYKAIAAGGYYSLAIDDANGYLYSWGENNYGQLGSGDKFNISSPTRVKMEETYYSNGYKTRVVTSTIKYKAVAAGSSHSLAISSDGYLYAWGQNTYGQVGNGSILSTSVVCPQKIGGYKYKAIAAGQWHSLAIRSDSKASDDSILYAWGRNNYGQVGDGSNINAYIPKRIYGDFASVAAGGNHSLAAGTGDGIYAWGQNSFGQLGDGTTVNKNVPVKVGTGKAIAAGMYHSFTINASCDLWAWGNNALGQVGDGKGAAERTTPSLVKTMLILVDIIYVPCGGDISYPIQTVYHTRSVGTHLTTTRPGYTFNGWFTKETGGSQVFTNTPIDKASLTTMTTSGNPYRLNLYAQWTVKTYKINFKKDTFSTGSLSVSPIDWKFGDKKYLPSQGNNLQRTGYDFAGWGTDSNGMTPIWNTSTQVTITSAKENGNSATFMSYLTAENGILYAQWKPKSYEIKFDAGGGTGYPSDKVKSWQYGKSNTLPTINEMKRTGYTFAGWGTQPDGLGNVIWTSGSNVNLSSSGNVAANINYNTTTIYAQWTPKTYYVTINSNGGTALGATLSWKFNTKITLYETWGVRTGYTFAGWGISPNGPVIWAPGAKDVLLSTRNAGSATNADYPYSSLSIDNTTLYAQWTPKDVTVTYDANGGFVSISKLTFKEGYDTSVSHPAPIRDGYTFGGWNTTGAGIDGKSVNDTEINKTNLPNMDTAGNPCTVTLYARWDARVVKVTFDTNKGSGTSEPDKIPQSVLNAYTNPNFDTMFGTLPTTSRIGYKFEGWNVEEDGSGAKITTASSSTSSKIPYDVVDYVKNVNNINSDCTITLYAQWSALQVKVTYNLNYGAAGVYATKYIEYDGKLGSDWPTEQTRIGYRFSGWYTTESGKGGKYVYKKYPDIIVTDDVNVINLPTALDTNNYTLKLYAIWIPDIVKVTFNTNQGTGSTEPNISGSNLIHDIGNNEYYGQYDYSGTFGILPEVSRDGYTSEGWYTAPTGGTKVNSGIINGTPVKDVVSNGTSVTLYAQWTAKEVTVHFNTMVSGLTINSSRIYFDDRFETLPEPSRTGYTFAGWYTASTGGTEVTNSTDANLATIPNETSVTLFARWEVKTFTIEFVVDPEDKLGGYAVNVLSPEGFTIDQDYNMTTIANVKYGTKLNDLNPELPVLEYSQLDYIFAGWYKYNFKDGKHNYTIVETVDSDIGGVFTLYARWDDSAKFSITFDSDGGTKVPVLTNVNAGTPITTNSHKPVDDPTREGHIFTGWYESPGSNNLFVWDGSYELVHDITLYAGWDKESYTVSFDLNGGEANPTIDVSNKIVSFGDSLSQLVPIIERTGYTLSHWEYTYIPYGESVPITVEIYLGDNNNHPMPDIGATGDVLTLTAKWTPNEYHITFYGDGGTISSNGSLITSSFPFEYETAITGLGYITTAKPGYEFDGWRISWDQEQKTTGATIDLESWLATEFPNGMPACDITITALWKAIKCNVTVVVDGIGGSLGTIDYGTTYEEMFSHFKYQNPEKAGHDFVGWSTTAGSESADINLSQEITGINTFLYAVWKNSVYKITFDLNGGSISGNPSTEYEYEYGDVIDSPGTPQRSGWNSKGWYYDNNGEHIYYVPGMTADRDITFTARYGAIITLVLNGGTASGVAVKVLPESPLDIYAGWSVTPDVRKGYDFGGWYEDESLTIPCNDYRYYQNGKFDDRTYYAKWTLKKYTVVFNAAGGTGAPGAITDWEYNTSRTLPGLGSLQRTGYTFEGWWISENGYVNNPNNRYIAGASITLSSGIFGISGVETNNLTVTLYAQWAVVGSITMVFEVGSKSSYVTGKPGIDLVDVPDDFKNIELRAGATGYYWTIDGVNKETFPMLTPSDGRVVTLVWEWAVFTVKFVANGKTETFTAVYGKPVSDYLPKNNPDKTGKNEYFLNWKGYIPGMLVVGNHTFTAVFADEEAKNCDLTFKFPADIHVDIVTPAVKGHDISLYLPDMTAYLPTIENPITTSGLIFLGWKGYTAGQKVNGDQEFEAMFEFISDIDKYVTIKYRSDGELIHEVVAADGTQVWLITPPTIVKSGKVFKSWKTEYTGGGVITAASAPDGITFTAVWANKDAPQTSVAVILILVAFSFAIASAAFVVIKRVYIQKI